MALIVLNIQVWTKSIASRMGSIGWSNLCWHEARVAAFFERPSLGFDRSDETHNALHRTRSDEDGRGGVMTKCVYIFSFVFTFLIGASTQVYAAGFEYRDYTQGMSKSEVEAISKRKGRSIRIEESYWDILLRDEPIATVQFCQNKLSRVFYLVDGGFMRYLKVTNECMK